MKKILSALLILALMLGCICAQADAAAVYASDFTEDTDGWVARSMGTAQIEIRDGVLFIQGRQSDWNSPGRDFHLIAGVRYTLSVQVLQEDVDSAAFMISVAHSLNGVESYENLARGTAKKGEWTTLTGDYTPGPFDNYILYVETTGAATLNYAIKDFTVTAPDGLPDETAEEEKEALPSLKEIYAGRFDFGIAAPQFLIRSGGAALTLIQQQFSILTPENEMKPDAILDVNASRKLAQEDETAAAVHFDAAKPLLDFAQKNGIKVHGHVLVWHGQTPEAFFHEGYDTAKPLVAREVMLGRLENYIKGVMEYLDANYPGVVVSWDVVNEAVDDGAAYLRASNWTKVVGDDFLARAFEIARKYAPEGTLLYYNDYNTAVPGKLTKIYKLMESLIAEGNIDGYGFQMHHSITYPPMNQITAAVEKIASLGVKLRISELDVGIDILSEDQLQKQASLYGRIMQLADRFADQFEAVQVWGLTDNMSWRSKNNPLLFDAALNPKPAFWAVADPSSVE